MTTEQKTFIENIAAAARKHAANYGIAVISPIIAQAINESGWGKSTLAAKEWKDQRETKRIEQRFITATHIAVGNVAATRTKTN